MTAPPCLGFLCSSSQTRKGPSWCMYLNSKTAMLPRHGTSTACTSSVWLHEVAHDRCVETASADTASIGSETANIGSYGHTVLCGGTPGSNRSMLCTAGTLSSFFTSALFTLSRLRALAAAGVPPPTNASCEWRRAVHSSSLFFFSHGPVPQSAANPARACCGLFCATPCHPANQRLSTPKCINEGPGKSQSCGT